MSSDTTDPNKNVRFAEGMREREMKFMPDQLQVAAGQRPEGELERTAPRTVGVMEEQFPTDALTAYDPRDRVQAAKLQLQDPAKPGYTQFGKLIAKDSDFEWYQKKQAAQEVANFQAWFAKEFDLMSPAQKLRAKELYPEFYRERKRTLKKNAKNLMNLARIKLEGPSSLEDVKTLYLAETGRLNLGPVQNLLHPEKDAGIWEPMNKTYADEIFVRGLANPFMVYGKQAYPSSAGAREVRAKDWAGMNYTGLDSFTEKVDDVNDEQWFSQLKKALGTLQ